jgi:hypothetical protein
MPRGTTPPKGASKAGKPAAETATTEVATEAVTAAAAGMGDVEDVGERETVVGAPPVATMNDDTFVGEGGPPPDDAPPPSAAAHIPTPLAEPVAPEVLEAAGGPPVEESAAAPAAPPASDETFFRCNGCGRPGPAADTAEASLEKALAEGWYMSQHTPPLPYCCGGGVEDPSQFPFGPRGRPAPTPPAG